MVKKFYKPEGYSCDIEVEVTEEQAKQLDKLWEKEQFSAYFWAEKVDWLNKGNKKVARINGQHHVIGDESVSDFWKGCGGNQFKIKYFSGEEIVTTNLWHQGEIPEELKEILKDNAEWI
jgi:hypothetical protein